MFEIAVYPEERSTTNQLRPAVLCSKGAAPRSFGNGEKGGKRDRNEGHVHEVGESAPPGYLLFFFFGDSSMQIGRVDPICSSNNAWLLWGEWGGVQPVRREGLLHTVFLLRGGSC